MSAALHEKSGMRLFAEEALATVALSIFVWFCLCGPLDQLLHWLGLV